MAGGSTNSIGATTEVVSGDEASARVGARTDTHTHTLNLLKMCVFNCVLCALDVKCGKVWRKSPISSLFFPQHDKHTHTDRKTDRQTGTPRCVVTQRFVLGLDAPAGR